MTVRTWLRDVPVDCLDVGRLLALVDEFVRSGSSHRISYLNAHCFNLARRDEAYREILRRSDVVYADGKGVVWACRWFARPVPGRLNLGDCLPMLCDHCVERGYRLYLLGGVPGIAARAAESLRRAHPGLEIVGCRHGHFSSAEEPRVWEEIRHARPHILLVGMGVPKQEKWVTSYQGRLQVPVCWGVGALFEYFAGVTPRAPGLLRTIGLEWIFRLYHEPRRLWRRYVVGIPRFLLSVGRDALRDGALVCLAWTAGLASLGGSGGVRLAATGGLLAAVGWLPAAVGLGLYRCWTRKSFGAAAAAGLAGATFAVTAGSLVSYYLSTASLLPAFIGWVVALLLCSRIVALRNLRRSAASGLERTQAGS